jgi:hypothetical protein
MGYFGFEQLLLNNTEQEKHLLRQQVSAAEQFGFTGLLIGAAFFVKK